MHARASILMLAILAIGSLAEGSTWFAVKPAGQLVVINGSIYCWRLENPKTAWNPDRPKLPKAFNPEWIRLDISDHYIVRSGSLSAKNYLSAGAQGRVILVEKSERTPRWLIEKDPDQWPESTNERADIITLYKVRFTSREGENNCLGLADNPETFDDEQGNKIKLYPLVLTDDAHSIRLAYNDYSGK